MSKLEQYGEVARLDAEIAALDAEVARLDAEIARLDAVLLSGSAPDSPLASGGAVREPVSKTPDYDVAVSECAIKSEHAVRSADLMDESFEITLFEIRGLDETWNCPVEETL